MSLWCWSWRRILAAIVKVFLAARVPFVLLSLSFVLINASLASPYFSFLKTSINNTLIPSRLIPTNQQVSYHVCKMNLLAYIFHSSTPVLKPGERNLLREGDDNHYRRAQDGIDQHYVQGQLISNART